MTTLAPEQITGTRCGEMIGQGMVAYRCEREVGHAMIPESDPEPHYAVEVGRSVRAWQSWRQRQMEREAHPSVTILGGVSCPTCSKPMRESNAHGVSAVCVDPECSQEPIDIAQPKEAKSDWPFNPEFDQTANAVIEGTYTPEEMQAKAYLRQKPGKDAPWEDVVDRERISESQTLELMPCPRTVRHDHHYWGMKDEVEVYQCTGEPHGDTPAPEAQIEEVPVVVIPTVELEADDEDLRAFVDRTAKKSPVSAYDEDMPGPVSAPSSFAVSPYPHWLTFGDDDRPDASELAQIEAMHTVILEEAPVSDDEVLTIHYVGGQIQTRVVDKAEYYFGEVIPQPTEPTKQREGDQPLPDGGVACVQDRIIEAMEESKRVGLQRYGSTLMTFNGRKGFQDVVEEARDFFVYVTQVQMEAEATRDQLEVVVANRIKPLLEGYGVPGGVWNDIATIAVDAVMGWVTGQSQEAPSQPTG